MAEAPYRAAEPRAPTCAICPATLSAVVYMHDGQRVYGIFVMTIAVIFAWIAYDTLFKYHPGP